MRTPASRKQDTPPPPIVGKCLQMRHAGFYVMIQRLVTWPSQNKPKRKKKNIYIYIYLSQRYEIHSVHPVHLYPDCETWEILRKERRVQGPGTINRVNVCLRRGEKARPRPPASKSCTEYPARFEYLTLPYLTLS